jgi:perosamine synthetase
MMIPLARPDIGCKEMEYVTQVIRSDRLSIGPFLEKFENQFKDYFGIKHAIGVNSGTSGLHLLVRAMGISPVHEVITTPFSFIASTNCFLYEGARPVFVDIDEDTFNIDIGKLEEKITPRTKLILPVDVFGQPVDISAINNIAERYHLWVIEDACEAIGAEFNGFKSGTLAHGAVFAFYPNKQITTAEGGMIITNDDKIADLCSSMRDQGRSLIEIWLHHERLGYNYRMSELSAAVGVAQMERLDDILAQRQKVAHMYNERLKDVAGIKIPYIASEVTRMSWFVYVVRLDQGIDRDNVIEYLMENNIECKPYFPPIHLQPYMKKKFGFSEGDFPVAEKVGKSTIALPFYNKLGTEHIDYVAEKLNESIKRYRKTDSFFHPAR